MANSLQAVLNRAKIDQENAGQPNHNGGPMTRKRPPNKAVSVKLEDKSVPKPSRTDTRLICGHFSAAVSMQLRMIAAEDDTTIQNLLAEALDDLFVKRGKARVARV